MYAVFKTIIDDSCDLVIPIQDFIYKYSDRMQAIDVFKQKYAAVAALNNYYSAELNCVDPSELERGINYDYNKDHDDAWYSLYFSVRWFIWEVSGEEAVVKFELK